MVNPGGLLGLAKTIGAYGLHRKNRFNMLFSRFGVPRHSPGKSLPTRTAVLVSGGSTPAFYGACGGRGHSPPAGGISNNGTI